MMEKEIKLSPEQYAQIVEEQKPYLIAIEEHVHNLEFGVLRVEMSVRAGVVPKMTFIEEKTWLKDKTA